MVLWPPIARLPSIRRSAWVHPKPLKCQWEAWRDRHIEPMAHRRRACYGRRRGSYRGAVRTVWAQAFDRRRDGSLRRNGAACNIARPIARVLHNKSDWSRMRPRCLRSWTRETPIDPRRLDWTGPMPESARTSGVAMERTPGRTSDSFRLADVVMFRLQ